MTWVARSEVLTEVLGLQGRSYPSIWIVTERLYRGTDKSLAQPGRKQANVSVRMLWISCSALPRRRKNLMTAHVSMLLKLHASLTCFRACFLPGRAKDLSAPWYFYTSKDPETEKLLNECMLLTFYNWSYCSEQWMWIQGEFMCLFKEATRFRIVYKWCYIMVTSDVGPSTEK